MLLIHSETVCPDAFAAAFTRLIASPFKRTWIVRAFTSPLGSLGRPIFLGFGFCWLKVSELLYDCRSHGRGCRCYGTKMQHGNVQACSGV
jgi:hypothetical protein